MAKNPLHKIKHDAFRECKKITSLDLNHTSFKNYRGDLKFLKRLYELEDLDLSFAFVEQDFNDLTRIYEVLTLQKLDMRGVGLVSIAEIKKKFPNLVYLDVRDNKLVSFDLIEALRGLSDFADINLKGNPICIHKHLKEELIQFLPFIERVNGEEIHKSGWKY